MGTLNLHWGSPSDEWHIIIQSIVHCLLHDHNLHANIHTLRPEVAIVAPLAPN